MRELTSFFLEMMMVLGKKFTTVDKNVNVHFIFSLSLFIMDLKKIETETFFYDLSPYQSYPPQITSDSDGLFC